MSVDEHQSRLAAKTTQLLESWRVAPSHSQPLQRDAQFLTVLAKAAHGLRSDLVGSTQSCHRALPNLLCCEARLVKMTFPKLSFEFGYSNFYLIEYWSLRFFSSIFI